MERPANTPVVSQPQQKVVVHAHERKNSEKESEESADDIINLEINNNNLQDLSKITDTCQDEVDDSIVICGGAQPEPEGTKEGEARGAADARKGVGKRTACR